jgi:hypothetical protein
MAGGGEVSHDERRLAGEKCARMELGECSALAHVDACQSCLSSIDSTGDQRCDGFVSFSLLYFCDMTDMTFTNPGKV